MPYQSASRRSHSLVARIGFSLLLVAAVAAPHALHAELSFDPAAVLSFPPIDRPTTPDLGLPPAAPPPFVPPEGLEKYLQRKRAAVHDPLAQPPDAIVPLATSARVLESRAQGAGPLVHLASPASIITSFAGLDQLSVPENDTNPPDTTLAKSGFRVLEAVNASLRLSQNAGNTIQTKSLMSFFSAFPGDGVMFDPRVIFDRIGPNLRFYVVAGQLDLQARKSNVYFAVSRSPNPTNLEAASWCRYWMPGDPGTPLASFADYPMLGVGADTLVLSINQATYSPLDFGYAVIYAFIKTSLSNNATECPTAIANFFQPTTTRNDLNIYSLQPVEHYTAPSSGSGWINPVYLVSTAEPPTSIYRVWAVRNVVGGGAALSVVDVNGTYVFNSPADAPQAGTPILLDTNNWRIRQAAGRADSIWAAQTTICNGNPATPTESCARVVKLNVTPGSGSSNHQVTFQAGTTFGGGENTYYWMPGIAVNTSLQTTVTFQHSTAASYLSSSWSLKNDANPSYPAAQALTTGTCPMTQFPQGNFTRTGDYVGSQTNPNDLASFWLAGERATTLGGSCRWETRIIQVTP